MNPALFWIIQEMTGPVSVRSVELTNHPNSRTDHRTPTSRPAVRGLVSVANPSVSMLTARGLPFL